MSAIKKNVLLLVGLVLVATLILTVLSVFKPAPPVKADRPAPRIPVEVLSVTNTSFQVRLPSQGLVKARTRSRLAAQISGNIISTSPAFELGGSFKQGDILVTVDDADYQAAFKISQASVNQARVALQEEQARGRQALRDWQRLGNSAEPNELVQRKPQLMAAQAVLESAEAQLEKAGLDLSRTRIVAPYDGRVIADAIDAGNFVNKGQVLGVIVEAGSLQVELPLSAAWRHLLDWSGVNDQVQIRLPDAPVAVQWSATISKTSADISQTSRQFKLIADIDIDSASNPAIALFIGDYIDASIAGATLNDVVVLPRQAIYDDKYAWVVIGNKLVKRMVNIVWADNEYAVIDAGLETGDKIVTTALGAVVSGTAVRVIEADNDENEAISLEVSDIAVSASQG